jgi:hypothetical protein
MHVSGIRVIKRPRGEAPDHIRDQWLGLILPGVYCKAEDGSEVGLESRSLQPRRDHCLVPQNLAIGALELAGRLEAAEYFRQVGSSGFFTFGAEEVIDLGSE